MRASWNLVVCLILLVHSTAAAGGVAVFPVEGTNLLRGELDAIGVVLAEAYTTYSRQPVVGPRQAGEALEQAGSAPEAAAALGVELYVQVTAVRLEQKILLSATLFRADGTRTYRAETAVYSMDDMEQVAERLARSLHDRVPLEQTRTLHNVIKKEASPENRLFVEKVIGVKVAGLLGLPSGGVGCMGLVSAQFDMRMEARDFFLEFGAGLKLTATNDDPYPGALFLEIGASYYLMDANSSAYIGVGLIPRLDFTADPLVNLAPYAQVGVMFFRESSTRIYLDIRASHDLFVHESDYDDYDSEERKYRLTELALLVGIGW